MTPPKKSKFRGNAANSDMDASSYQGNPTEDDFEDEDDDNVRDDPTANASMHYKQLLNSQGDSDKGTRKQGRQPTRRNGFRFQKDL